MTVPSFMIRDLPQNSVKRPNKNNMDISIICFSLTGFQTALKLQEGLNAQGYHTELYKKSKYLEDSVTESTGNWTAEHFQKDDGLIFVGACGIAVRSIAPQVASKKSDPAVLVVDECGQFVISLLSGHLGGANELSLKAAQILGAQPVVTTATDLHKQFAVDVFAKKNGCEILFMKAAKEVSAALLAGEPVGFYSEFPLVGALPNGLTECDAEGIPFEGGSAPEIGVAVTIHPSCLPFASTTQVVPPAVTLGMGCRKNKEADIIRREAENCLMESDIYRQAIGNLASISLKKDEPGLNALAEEWKIPFITYTEEELKEVEGEFTPSAFVRTITGVENVCERSAVLASGNGSLIRKKTGREGVTTALGLRKWEVHFE